MRSVARRVQFVNQLMRLESDYLEEGEGGGRRGEERNAWRGGRRTYRSECRVAVNEFVSSTGEDGDWRPRLLYR